MTTTQPNPITLAILHGSQATGNANGHSDWDVAVLSDHPLSWDDRSRLRRVFAKTLDVPEDRIDIADLRRGAPLFRYRVAANGRLIHGRSRDFREFQIRAWKEYLNNQKFFDLQNAFLKKILS